MVVDVVLVTTVGLRQVACAARVVVVVGIKVGGVVIGSVRDNSETVVSALVARLKVCDSGSRRPDRPVLARRATVTSVPPHILSRHIVEHPNGEKQIATLARELGVVLRRPARIGQVRFG